MISQHSALQKQRTQRNSTCYIYLDYDSRQGGNLHDNDNCSIHTTATVSSPTVPFTEESMVKLLTAYKSLRDLENLLSMIAGIDPSNGLLSNLRHMDNQGIMIMV